MLDGDDASRAVQRPEGPIAGAVRPAHVTVFDAGGQVGPKSLGLNAHARGLAVGHVGDADCLGAVGAAAMARAAARYRTRVGPLERSCRSPRSSGQPSEGLSATTDRLVEIAPELAEWPMWARAVEPQAFCDEPGEGRTSQRLCDPGPLAHDERRSSCSRRVEQAGEAGGPP
jgi:hypothetical protein